MERSNNNEQSSDSSNEFPPEGRAGLFWPPRQDVPAVAVAALTSSVQFPPAASFSAVQHSLSAQQAVARMLQAPSRGGPAAYRYHQSAILPGWLENAQQEGPGNQIGGAQIGLSSSGPFSVLPRGFGHHETSGFSAASAATSAPPAALLSSGADAEMERLRERARHGVHETISQMPLDRKQAYLEALEKAPQVVRTETDPLLFVRRCDYDVNAASDRLCRYWQERIRLFGSERAFLPLVLSGDGALTPEDVNNLHSGFPALLPDTTSGQKVLFSDRRKCIPTASKESCLRSGFYLHNFLVQSDERTQTQGVLAIVVLVSPRIEPADIGQMKQLMYNAANIFPTKLDVHFLVLPPRPRAGKRYVVQELVAEVAGFALEQEGFASVNTHVEREPGQVLQELLDLGLTQAGIPLSLGGSWKFESFFHWCQVREQEERELHGTPKRAPVAMAAAAAPVVAGMMTTTGTEDDEQPSINDMSLSLEERKSRKRLYDVLHARRKREEQKELSQSLKKESSELREQQKKLKADNKLLIRLSKQATDVLAGLEGSSSKRKTG